MPFDIRRHPDRALGEQRRAHDQGVDLLQNGHGAVTRPGARTGHTPPDRDIEPAAKLLMHRGDRRHRHLHMRLFQAEALQAGDQPAHGKTGGGTHPQDAQHAGPAAGFGRRDHAIEREAHLGSEDAGDRGGDHAPPAPGKQALAQPALQCRDLPAHGSMGQP